MAVLDICQITMVDVISAFDFLLNEFGAPVLITNPRLHDNPIVYVNKLFTLMSGYSPSDIYGQNARIFRSTKFDPNIRALMKEVISRNLSFSGIIWNVSKYGEDYATKTTIKPVFNNDNVLIYYTAVYQPLNAEEIVGIHETGKILTELTIKFDLIHKSLNHIDNSLLKARGLPLDYDEL